ncbi:MAG: O-antigen ligase family protein [Coriobacteriia bacterium]|nr:O-antigen ligase family protein [Coriobacteriia bacterium]
MVAVVGISVMVLAWAYPKPAMYAALLSVLLFREETWQMTFLGMPTLGVQTFYTMNYGGVTIQLALVGPAFLRTVWDVPRTRLRVNSALDVWLVVLLLVDVLGEIWGRVQSGYSALFMGHAQYFALPVMAAIVVRQWFTVHDARRLSRAFFLLALLRTSYGLGRYALGYGDIHFELGKRIVFWDIADGLFAAAVATVGIVLLFAERRALWRGVGLVAVAAGIATVALSLRRAPMLSLVVGVSVGLWVFASSYSRNVRALRMRALTTAAIVVGALLAQPPDTVVRTRFLSSFRAGGPLAATNMWHIADLIDGLRAALRRPLTGWGYHVAPPRLVDYLQVQSASIESVGLYHNMYIYSWIRMGILGLLGVVATGALGMRSGRQVAAERRDAVLGSSLVGIIASIMIAGLTSHTLWSFRIPYVYFGAAAIGTVLAASRDVDGQSRE